MTAARESATPDAGGASDSRDALVQDARRTLGLRADQAGPPEPMRVTLAANGLSWYPLVALGLLAAVDTFHTYAFAVLTPEISRTLGIGKGAIAAIIAAKTLAIAVAPIPMAALAQRGRRRALLCIATALAWSAGGAAIGFVTLGAGLAVLLVVDGLSTGSVSALHQPLLLDSYPARARVRALSLYHGANAAGNVFAPLAVGLLTAALDFTWRAVFVALGAASLVATVAASRLRDPGIGRWDEDAIRQAVEADEPRAETEQRPSDAPALGFFEVVRRLLLIPTVRTLLVAQAVFGILVIPYQTFLFFFLEERWGMGPGARGALFALMAASAIAALAVFARAGERRFRSEPGALVRFGGGLLALGVTCICAAGLSPWFWPMVLLLAAAAACVAVLAPATNATLLSVVPSSMRSHAAALVGLSVGGAGGLLGALFLSGVDSRFGVAGSLVSLVVPGLLGALLLARSGRLVEGDLDRMISDVIEEEEARRVDRSGGTVPLLACRGVDFSYGQLQVLFGVDFSVDDGEMVALLGTNGAGKSTLLRVISGIGLPSAGSVRYRGHDITYLDAERRLRLGITQVPGGRAVFGALSVVENLRGFAYSLGRDPGRVDAALDRCFETFPRLAERRNQDARTLSGGEQQMLALSKALILRPRLLLIDELSLGLAPVVVGQLLDLVRDINADGTAVVLVEQSVNVALNLVDHAYFMEKGEVRFDGVAKDLLARDDLLRAVFLEGAGAKA